MSAHDKSPPRLRLIWKNYQRIKVSLLDLPGSVAQFDSVSRTFPGAHLVTDYKHSSRKLHDTFNEFIDALIDPFLPSSDAHGMAFTFPQVPGLTVFPSILPPEVQICLLDRLFHRDLSDPQHLTNVHLHHDVPYAPQSASYFSPAARSLCFQPKDHTVHKPFTTEHFLNKKLRWATLGGQYDWTYKAYPSSQPPPFPADVKHLVEEIFPLKAEAAILNVYSPGDTLSLHRDMSEQCDRPLVSISIGCDAIFMCGLDDDRDGTEPRVAVLRLRSGDAVLMSDESRYAWHGVPKVLEDTCPDWLRDWPATPCLASSGNDKSGFESWKGWMKSKRINLNVRQMFD